MIVKSWDTPRVLGLTGGIGAGKSFVGHMLERAGLPLFDSDAVARSAYTESDEVRRQVVDLLGAECYDATGEPRYSEIARIVFSSSSSESSLLQRLEEIIHPYVRACLEEWAKAQETPTGWVVLESAILWQSGFYRYCDAVAIVTAPEAVRVARVRERDGATTEQVKARISRQEDPSLTSLQRAYPEMPIYTIDNSGAHRIEDQVVRVVRQLGTL